MTTFVVVGLSDRPGTAPAVYGSWDTSEEGRRARARVRRRLAREEADFETAAYLCALQEENPPEEQPDSTEEIRARAEGTVCDLLGAADFEGMEVCDFAAVVVQRLLDSGLVTLGGTS